MTSGSPQRARFGERQSAQTGAGLHTRAEARVLQPDTPNDFEHGEASVLDARHPQLVQADESERGQLRRAEHERLDGIVLNCTV